MIGATLESWHSRAMRVVVEGVGATGRCGWEKRKAKGRFRRRFLSWRVKLMGNEGTAWALPFMERFLCYSVDRIERAPFQIWCCPKVERCPVRIGCCPELAGVGSGVLDAAWS